MAVEVISLIKPASNYQYFTLKKGLTLSRRGKDVFMPVGSKVGIRAAGSKPGALRLITPGTGTTIIYTIAKESVPSLMKILKPV